MNPNQPEGLEDTLKQYRFEKNNSFQKNERRSAEKGDPYLQSQSVCDRGDCSLKKTEKM